MVTVVSAIKELFMSYASLGRVILQGGDLLSLITQSWQHTILSQGHSSLICHFIGTSRNDVCLSCRKYCIDGR